MNYTGKEVYTYNGEDVEFQYSSSATYLEQITFVNTVTSVVANEDYMPLLKDIIFNYTLVSMFTDIDVTMFETKGNVDIDTFADFDKQTGVSDFLKSVIDEDIIYSLNDSVDCNIAYKTGIHRDSVSTAIVDLIKVAERKLSAWDGNIDSKEVAKFIEKFNVSDLNAESVVKTYLNTDIHKNKVSDVVEAKNKEIKELKGS